ncbi:hypothetical protein [Fluviispira multicolorata]|uniref:Uncharacterized protein n=1 Tax=Fluviispira multicolorata TaxID=2654512 RepID=A0A833JDE1_9BACT|nr:hypothetical protein [Fluviispira multicolorata]KAB8031828.1 hypothetical protein GCL57_04080 [Fluviispira multicolorata]
MGDSNRTSFDISNNEKALSVPIGAHEAQNFMNDVIRNTYSRSKDSQNKTEIKKRWFWLGFIGGVFISCLGIFFVFTTVYFIQYSIFEKPNLIYNKAICEIK